MKHIIHPTKQKFVIVAAAVFASVLGFQAASAALDAYEVSAFFSIAAYVYLFLFFLELFVFDLHLKNARSLKTLEKTFLSGIQRRFYYLAEPRHFMHFLNYLILPGIIYWMTILLLYLDPFETASKQGLIAVSSLALAISFWYMKAVFYEHHEASRITRQWIFFTKLYASYIAYAAAFGITRYFGPYSGDRDLGYAVLGTYWFSLVVFCVTFALLYQALFQHHHISFRMLNIILLAAALIALVSYFVYETWNANYYSGALVLSGIYNTIWGIIHHKFIDHNLTREAVYEYLAVLFVILVIVFSTTNFSERVY